MAFKRGDIRDILTKAGISDDNIESAITDIVKLHISVVDPLKTENESLESKAKQAEKLKSQLDDAKTKLAEYEEADYKGKYEAEKANSEKIKTEYENYKTEQTGKAARAAKEAAYRDILKDAGIPEKHFAKIIKYSDIDSIELDDKGKVKKSADILKSVKEEWGDHVETVQTKGTDTPNPPVDKNGGKKLTKEDIYKTDDKGNFVMDSASRQKAIAENPDLFT